MSPRPWPGARVALPSEVPALDSAWLRGIFESASDGILTTDASQTIVAANPASARMFRCTVADLIGSPLDRLIPARYREAHRQLVAAFGSGAPGSRPMRDSQVGRTVTALRFDGEEFPIEASISFTEVEGQRLYTVIHRDVTEQRRAAALQRDSQQLLAATFGRSSVATAQIDIETRRYCAVNVAFCDLTGYAEAELRDMTPDDLNHPDHRVDPAKLDALLRFDVPYREENCIVRKDGTVLWVEVTGSVVRDADGRPLRLVDLLHDITARRQAEDALRRSEARQAFLLNLGDRLRELDDPRSIVHEASRLLGEFVGAQRVGYGEDDGDGQWVTAGPNYACGVQPLEGRYRYGSAAIMQALLAGHTQVRSDVAQDPSLGPQQKAAYANLQIGAAVAVPLSHDSHMQAIFFVHSREARRWTDDEVHLFGDVARRLRADVERARAQAAMRSAKSRLQAALDSMNDAVLISDAEGCFVDFNDAFVSFHRFHRREDCRRRLDDYPEILEVSMADGSPAPLSQWAVPRALRGETASNQEYRLRRKDTGESWVGSYSLAPIRSDDGRVVGSVVVGRDITSIKRTQEDLATSYATLQKLVTAVQRAQEDERKRIARELHDDLQQSLAAIRMDAVAADERLAKGRTDLAPLLARIDRLSGAAIESTRRIVGDLRPEMLEELGLIPALEALCAEHARRWTIDCRLEVSGGDATGTPDGRALSIGLYRIVQEALNNVAKHAKASEARVWLDFSREGLIVLRIADNGTGLRPRAQRVPEAFGLLGMAERARAIGGQLRIEASPGRGTSIEVTVPIGHEDARVRGAGAPQQPGPDREAGPQAATLEDLWGRPLQAVIDAMDGNVAVLDRSGMVRLVNRAWHAFAARHGDPDLTGCGPGTSYLEVCRRCAADDPFARAALQGLSAVLEGRDEAFVTEYPCDTPEACLWFRLHAAPIHGGWTMVSHVEIRRTDPDPGTDPVQPSGASFR